MLAIADSDSYVKWAASVLGELPGAWERQLVLLATPVMPSEAQLEAALSGSSVDVDAVSLLELDAVTALVAEQRPDVVFVSVRGPAVRVVVRAISAARGASRPVLVSGMPGITFPATRRALVYRSQIDLLVLHSKRERASYLERADESGLPRPRIGLASLAFLARDRPVGGDGSHRLGDEDAAGTSARNIVFAVQSTVPSTLDDRISVLRWLAESARRHPDARVIVKLRALRGEHQTHFEANPYDGLVSELEAVPENLVFATGPMAEHLDDAAALVTVSSTAALEAVARGIPALVLSDFGVTAKLINLVFEGSGLLGTSHDLIDGRFARADARWLDENYFHDDADNDWLDQLAGLLAVRDRGEFPLRAAAREPIGGRLRRGWDRRRVLGGHDRSITGSIAVVVGTPARWALVRARRLRRRMQRGALLSRRR